MSNNTDPKLLFDTENAPSVHTIVAYLIHRNKTPNKKMPTNLGIQKRLYYIKAFYMLMFNELAYTDEILAWQYGPVVSEIYNSLNTFGGKVIDINKLPSIYKFEETKKLTDDPQYKNLLIICDIIDEICSGYNDFKLSDFTHLESPWKNNYKSPDEKNAPISNEDLFFNFPFAPDVDDVKVSEENKEYTKFIKNIYRKLHKAFPEGTENFQFIDDTKPIETKIYQEVLQNSKISSNLDTNLVSEMDDFFKKL